MGKRPKRKIVLFLVEGKSDREALKLAIQSYMIRLMRISKSIFR